MPHDLQLSDKAFSGILIGENVCLFLYRHSLIVAFLPGFHHLAVGATPYERDQLIFVFEDLPRAHIFLN